MIPYVVAGLLGVLIALFGAFSQVSRSPAEHEVIHPELPPVQRTRRLWGHGESKGSHPPVVDTTLLDRGACMSL